MPLIRARSDVHSIRTELLFNLALLVVAALAFAVAAVALMASRVATARGAVYLVLLVGIDAVVFVALAAAQVERMIGRPLAATLAAAEAIANGDLARRLPADGSVELAALATSVNRVTDHLLQERAHLVRAEKLASVGRLAAGLAREIGSPLDAINGYARLLRPLATDGQARTALEGLESETNRIHRIVRGLVDYGRTQPREATCVDVNEAVRASYELLNTHGALSRVTVRLDLAGGSLNVRADRDELQRVFVNLLLHAADAMPDGGEIAVRSAARARQGVALRASRRRTDTPETYVPREPSMRVMRWLAERQPGDVVKIVVADSGPGISPDLAERIFDPFVGTGHPERSTGMGLAVVARIIENSGGTIWVEPSRAGGAAFHLLLPLESA